MTHKEFTLKTEAIPDVELAEIADLAISKLCKTGGKSFTMTIPPRIDDTDIILSEIVRRFEKRSWIKICSKVDLPKEQGVYWTLRRGFHKPMYKVVEFFDSEENEYWLKSYTHYQYIQRPLNLPLD